MFIKNFPKSLLDKCPPEARLGQWVVHNRHKTMSMMFGDEVEWRQRLWSVPNDKFWEEFGEIVDSSK